MHVIRHQAVSRPARTGLSLAFSYKGVSLPLDQLTLKSRGPQVIAHEIEDVAGARSPLIAAPAFLTFTLTIRAGHRQTGRRKGQFPCDSRLVGAAARSGGLSLFACCGTIFRALKAEHSNAHSFPASQLFQKPSVPASVVFPRPGSVRQKRGTPSWNS